MANRLLDRQVSLITYLTSGAAIFGDDNAPLADPALQGFDPQLLHLEARFSHEKRMEKIAGGVFAHAGLARHGASEARAGSLPRAVRRSASAGSRTRGSSTHFSPGVWRFRPPGLPYLPDLAACELAFAEVRNWVADASADETPKEGGAEARPRSIRRHPGVAAAEVRLRCAAAVRSG